MPTRILRDGILTSERVDLLNWQEEVFYRRLQSVVDDHGRFYANPKLILAACFPLRIGKVSDSDIGKWLTACVAADLVRVYPSSDGKRYIEVMDFGQRVQSKSKFPAFNGAAQESTVDHGGSPESTVKNGLVVVGVEGVSEGVGVDAEPPAPKRRKPNKTFLADDFAVSDAVKAWAESKGITRLDDHFESFKAKAKAKAYEYADWDAALMNAIRDDWAKLGSSAATTKRRKQLGEGSSTNYGDRT
jgi:hypothetical protein